MIRFSLKDLFKRRATRSSYSRSSTSSTETSDKKRRGILHLSATTAKFIVGILLLLAFLIFLFVAIIQYLTSEPVVFLQQVTTTGIRIPVFVFVLPISPLSYATLLQQRNAVFQIYNTTTQKAVRLSSVLKVQYNENQTSERTVLTAIPKVPEFEYGGYSIEFSYNVSSALALEPALLNPGRFYNYLYVFGSKFTSYEFGTNISHKFEDFSNSSASYSFSYFSGGVPPRDVNPSIINSAVGSSSHFKVTPNKYTHLNKSDEYFYELSYQGSSAYLNQSFQLYTTMTLLSDQRIQNYYSESKKTPLITVLGVVMSAFQFILITAGLMIFGRGKYSPYGLIHKWFPEEAIKNYKPTPEIDPEYDRFRYLMMSYLDTSILEKNQVRRKVREANRLSMVSSGYSVVESSDDDSDEDVKGFRPGKGTVRIMKKLPWWKRVILSPVIPSWMLGMLALLFLLLPLVLGTLNTTAMYFLKVTSAQGSDRVLYLGIYTPIIVDGGNQYTYIPALAEELTGDFNYFVFPPESITFTSNNFIDQSSNLAYGPGARPLLALLLLVLTFVFLLLSFVIRLGAVAFEVQLVMDVADTLVPLFSILAAIAGIVDFAFLMTWFGVMDDVLNRQGTYAKTSFGPGLYVTTIGLVFVLCLAGLAIFEGLRLRRIKIKKIETLKRQPYSRNSWLPPPVKLNPDGTLLHGSGGGSGGSSGIVGGGNGASRWSNVVDSNRNSAIEENHGVHGTFLGPKPPLSTPPNINQVLI
ncbi:hypothetical protein HK098_005063 [Nowakowskiella sp. JEL0407]|nr:hypothetical protein HK098_005063 [Nowakowskiella sp. JEL0407]